MNTRVLELHGEIDMLERERIAQEFAQIERLGPQSVAILDLSDVRYLDATFLNALVRVRNRLAAAQRETSICLVAPRSNMIWRLLEITELDSVFHLVDQIPAAVA